MKSENIKIEKWDAILFYDEKEMEYTIAYDGIGGATTSNSDKNIAIKKWISAMKLADAMYKSLYYSRYGKFPIQITQ